MMLLSGIITLWLYLSVLYVLFYYRIINPLFFSREFFYTYIVSMEIYMIVVLFGSIFWYFFGQKWWKIIYIDGVYYFDKRKQPKV